MVIVYILCLDDVSTANAAIEFTNEPTNVTVVEGENAYFPCEYTGTRILPSWTIDGRRYAHSSSLRDFRYNSSGLIVLHVTLDMNGVSVSCSFFFGSELIQSKTGYIIVVQPNVAGKKENSVGKL